MLRPLLLLTAPALATLALTSPASAATYCVHQPGTPCAAASTDMGANLQGALNAAKTTLAGDTVAIGAGTWSGSFSYLGSSWLDITGAGSATVLTEPATSYTAVLNGGSAHVSNLSVHLPAAPSVYGIVSTGQVDHVAVSGAPTDDSAGLTLIGGQASDVDVLLDQNAADAVHLGAGASITDSRLSGFIGVYAVATSAEPVRVQRVQMDTRGGGILAGGGSVAVDDSVIRFGALGSSALLAGACGTTVTADHVTVLSTDAKGTALAADCGSSGAPASLTVTNSIVRGALRAASRRGYNGGTADIHVSSTDIPTDPVVQVGPGTLTFGADDLPGVDPLFRAAPADLHLGPGSPALDAGTASAATLDLDGHPRVSGAASDLGAYERQVVPAPPGGAGPPAGAPVTPAPAAPSGPPVTPGPAPGVVRTHPVSISSLGLRLRAHRLTASFGLDRPVAVRLSWQRRRGRSWTRAHGLTRSVLSGRVSVTLPGRVARGVYRVRVTAGSTAVTRMIRVR